MQHHSGGLAALHTRMGRLFTSLSVRNKDHACLVGAHFKSGLIYSELTHLISISSANQCALGKMAMYRREGRAAGTPIVMQ